MPMIKVTENNELKELTTEDLATMLDVFERTRVNEPGVERCGIAVFKGPETYDLFKDMDGIGDISGWNTVVPLGALAQFQAIGQSGVPNGKPYRGRRLFYRICEGTLLYPKGIPIGIFRRKLQDTNGDWREDNDGWDIHSEERDRLKQLARGFTWMSQREKKIDMDRKAARMRAIESGDSSAFMEQFRRAMGIGMVAANEAEMPGAVDLGKVEVPKPRKAPAK